MLSGRSSLLISYTSMGISFMVKGTDKSLFALLPSALVLLLSVAVVLVVGFKDDFGCFLFRLLHFSGISKAITQPQPLHLPKRQLNSYNACAIYIVPVTVPSFTPTASIAFILQTVRTLCIAYTTCKVGYYCNTHIHHHAWSLH